MTTQQETHAILQCEQRRFAAFMEGDLRTLDALLAANLTFIHSNGHLESKSQFLEHLGAGDYQFDVIRADDVSVRVYGGVGVLTGTGQMRVQVRHHQASLRYRFTLVYHKVQDRWQIVAIHHTRLADR